MAKMTVYHGGYISVENPQVRIGRNTKDFGTGFYCTVIKEQAQRWAKRYDTKVVSIYEVRLNLDLNIKEFQEMTEEWLDFIIDCRSGKSHNYDIVIGAMADDQIYNYISDYIEGVITRDQFWSLAKFKYPTHQINFCTEKTKSDIDFHIVYDCRNRGRQYNFCKRMPAVSVQCIYQFDLFLIDIDKGGIQIQDTSEDGDGHSGNNNCF